MTRTAPSTRAAATTPPSTNPSGNVTVPSFLPSTAFYLAAGTVTVDPAERKVLIIHDPATDTYQLPRGRKDWGESLPATAVRETLEETGHLPRLLAVPLATRATLPQAATMIADPLHPCQLAARSARFDETGEVLLPGTARLAEEPFGVMQHYQGNGALAVVAWFVGVADSGGERREGTQMADEEYESLWVGYREAEEMMVDEAYAKVVRRGVELASAVVEEDGAVTVLSGCQQRADVNGCAD